MALEAIKSSAYDAGKVILKGGSAAASALGRVFEYTGKSLSGLAKKVAEWAKIFMSNLPVYTQYMVDYTKLGVKYLKSGIKYIQDNKNPVGVGIGMGISFAVLAYAASRFFPRSNDI